MTKEQVINKINEYVVDKTIPTIGIERYKKFLKEVLQNIETRRNVLGKPYKVTDQLIDKLVDKIIKAKQLEVIENNVIYIFFNGKKRSITEEMVNIPQIINKYKKKLKHYDNVLIIMKYKKFHYGFYITKNIKEGDFINKYINGIKQYMKYLNKINKKKKKKRKK